MFGVEVASWLGRVGFMYSIPETGRQISTNVYHNIVLDDCIHASYVLNDYSSMLRFSLQKDSQENVKYIPAIFIW